MCRVAALPSAARTEEEEGCEVWNGWHDRDAPDLHRLVPAALHVSDQICGRSGQHSAGRVRHAHAGRTSGAAHLHAFSKNQDTLHCYLFSLVFLLKRHLQKSKYTQMSHPVKL